MAVSTVFSLDKILKEFYSGPIRDQLNNEMLVFELFNRRKMNWVGRRVIMPVRVGRNLSGAFAGDNGALPPAGQQTYKDLTIESKYLYGRMSITGPAIAQAKASVGAFVNGLQQELDGAVETVKNAADLACFNGGGALGFVNDRAAAASTMQFSGNQSSLPMEPAQGIQCVVIRSDTYATIANGHLGTQLYVRQRAGIPGSVQFVNNAGVPAGNNLDLTGLAKGAVGTVVTISGNNTVPVNAPTTQEALGIYGNLGAGYYDGVGAVTHWGADRTTATGSTALQSTIQSAENTIASGVAGAGARSAVDTKRMQAILDDIADLSGESPDCMIAHYIFRQEYTALMSFTSEVAGGITTSRSKNVDGGDPGFNMGALSFNGIPLKVARQCGKGLLIFLNLKSWVCAEVEAPGMADLDGSVLSREASADAYEAFVRYYYNTVCTAPNRNGILTGISYAGV